MITLTLRGCSRYSYCVIPVRALYAVGDIVCRRDLAAVGLSEAVRIKQILYTPRVAPYTLIYKDMLNSLHNESHLCTQEEADELIAAYEAQQELLALRRTLPTCF